MTCYNCNEEGHRSADCTQERKERVARPQGERRGGRGEGRGEGRARGGDREPREPREPRPPMTCYNCGEEGHRSSDCTNEKVEGIVRPERVERPARGEGRGRGGDRDGEPRGERRGGRGRGGDRPRATEGEETQGAEEEKRAPRERRERVEQVEEEVGFTLDDYFAAKQASSTGILAGSKDVREREKIQDKVAAKEGEKERISTLTKELSSRETYATRSVANAELMGFQAPVEVDFDQDRAERGSRGGRGGARGGDRGGARGGDREPREPRGGRRGGRGGGGKLVVNDEAFPAL